MEWRRWTPLMWILLFGALSNSAQVQGSNGSPFFSALELGRHSPSSSPPISLDPVVNTYLQRLEVVAQETRGFLGRVTDAFGFSETKLPPIFRQDVAGEAPSFLLKLYRSLEGSGHEKNSAPHWAVGLLSYADHETVEARAAESIQADLERTVQETAERLRSTPETERPQRIIFLLDSLKLTGSIHPQLDALAKEFRRSGIIFERYYILSHESLAAANSDLGNSTSLDSRHNGLLLLSDGETGTRPAYLTRILTQAAVAPKAHVTAHIFEGGETALSSGLRLVTRTWSDHTPQSGKLELQLHRGHVPVESNFVENAAEASPEISRQAPIRAATDIAVILEHYFPESGHPADIRTRIGIFIAEAGQPAMPFTAEEMKLGTPEASTVEADIARQIIPENLSRALESALSESPQTLRILQSITTLEKERIAFLTQECHNAVYGFNHNGERLAGIRTGTGEMLFLNKREVNSLLQRIRGSHEALQTVEARTMERVRTRK